MSSTHNTSKYQHISRVSASTTQTLQQHHQYINHSSTMHHACQHNVQNTNTSTDYADRWDTLEIQNKFVPVWSCVLKKKRSEQENPFVSEKSCSLVHFKCEKQIYFFFLLFWPQKLAENSGLSKRSPIASLEQRIALLGQMDHVERRKNLSFVWNVFFFLQFTHLISPWCFQSFNKKHKIWEPEWMKKSPLWQTNAFASATSKLQKGVKTDATLIIN